MVRLVDRGGVVIILDLLDVWMDPIEVEVSWVSRLYSGSPLEESVGVVVLLTILSVGVSLFVNK